MDWRMQASCRDHPNPEIFSNDGRAEIRRANLELALETCYSCPVVLECKEHSSLDDRRWTIRGGVPPFSANFMPRGRPSPDIEDRITEYLNKGFCHGKTRHPVDSRMDLTIRKTRNGSGQDKYKISCVACEQERAARYKASKRAKIGA